MLLLVSHNKFDNTISKRSRLDRLCSSKFEGDRWRFHLDLCMSDSILESPEISLKSILKNFKDLIYVIIKLSEISLLCCIESISLLRRWRCRFLPEVIANL